MLNTEKQVKAKLKKLGYDLTKMRINAYTQQVFEWSEKRNAYVFVFNFYELSL